jgi:hypothetical protein
VRRRYRDITVFNLSMLDVIASAMGAFLIIMVIIIPYFNKESEDSKKKTQQLVEQNKQLNQENQKLRQQIQQIRKQLKQRAQTIKQQRQRIVKLERAQQKTKKMQGQQQAIKRQKQRIGDLEQEVKSLKNRLAKTFLLIVISWKSPRHDVDLHVVDPAGHEFSYARKSYPNAPGVLSEDDQRGPGREVWIVTKAPPGQYKVYYRFYNPHGNRNVAVVTGMVYHRDGYDRLPPKTLNKIREKVLVATITVHNDGRVTIR